MLSPPTPCFRTLRTTLPSGGLRAMTIGSNAGRNAVPHPCPPSPSSPTPLPFHNTLPPPPLPPLRVLGHRSAFGQDRAGRAEYPVVIGGLHYPVGAFHAVVLIDRVREIHALGHPRGVQPRNLVADLEPCILDPAHHPVPSACTTERCNIRTRLQRMQCSRSPRRAPRLEHLRRTHGTGTDVREGLPEPARIVPHPPPPPQPVGRVGDQGVDARFGQEREELDRVPEIERRP